MNIILTPSENLTVIQNFLKFNLVEYTEKIIWNNDLYDFSLIDNNNTLVILDFNAFIDTITVPDSLSTLVNCLGENNHLMVWSDRDSGLEYLKLEPLLENINKLINSHKISLIVDANILCLAELKNIKIFNTPNTWFEKKIPRKTVFNKESIEKDYILTIGAHRKHRDILWEKLKEKNLLENGFSTYHQTTNKYTEWVGSKNTFHAWHDGHPSMELYTNSNFEIVPETFYKDAYFITEKTTKPISCKLPFLVVTTAGYLEFLKSKGFKTFNSIIDESYDYEQDLKKRIDLVVEQVEYIIKTGSSNFYTKSINITEYNFNNLARIAGSWWVTMDEFLYKIVTDITKKLN